MNQTPDLAEQVIVPHLPWIIGGGMLLGLIAILARFVIAGLARFPELNARVDTGAGEIVHLDGVSPMCETLERACELAVRPAESSQGLSSP